MSPVVHRLVRSLPPVAHHVDLAQLGQLSSRTSAERLPVAQHVVVEQCALCLERYNPRFPSNHNACAQKFALGWSPQGATQSSLICMLRAAPRSLCSYSAMSSWWWR